MRTVWIRRVAAVAVVACACAAAHADQAKDFRNAINAGRSAAWRKDTGAAESSAAKANGLARTHADRAAVKVLYADIAFFSGRDADAKLAYKELARDPNADAGGRFRAYVGLLAATALKDGIERAARATHPVADALESAGVTPREKYAAYNEAAKNMARVRKYELTQAFLALADEVVPNKTAKKVRCRFMDDAPLGAAGWLLSDYIRNPANKETRFHDYNQRNADRLFADITTRRAVANDQGKKGYFFRNTGFYMGYDELGWHIFVLCGDRDIQDKVAGGESAGALEMFFTPSLGGDVYYQWIITLPAGKVSLYDWSSPHRGYRPLEGYYKSETVVSGEDIGTYIFIPWLAVYDTLPLDGETWRFGCIRWSPAGGLTWGGKVHETGQWGHVEFDRPTLTQTRAIKLSIARRAFGRYKKARATLTTRWADAMTGDRAFFDAKVKPAVERLDAYGESLEDHASLSRREVDELFQDAAPDWMEFGYLVSELRHAYLEGRLVSR